MILVVAVCVCVLVGCDVTVILTTVFPVVPVDLLLGNSESCNL